MKTVHKPAVLIKIDGIIQLKDDEKRNLTKKLDVQIDATVIISRIDYNAV